MTVRVKITGGEGPSGFPWGTVPRLKSRTYLLEDFQLGIVSDAKDDGFISAFEVLGEDKPAAPAVAAAAKDDAPALDSLEEEKTEADPPKKHALADLYEATFEKPLTKAEPSRKDLVTMYTAIFGDPPGKKYSSTVIKELVNATSS